MLNCCVCFLESKLPGNKQKRKKKRFKGWNFTVEKRWKIIIIKVFQMFYSLCIVSFLPSPLPRFTFRQFLVLSSKGMDFFFFFLYIYSLQLLLKYECVIFFPPRRCFNKLIKFILSFLYLICLNLNIRFDFAREFLEFWESFFFFNSIYFLKAFELFLSIGSSPSFPFV